MRFTCVGERAVYYYIHKLSVMLHTMVEKLLNSVAIVTLLSNGSVCFKIRQSFKYWDREFSKSQKIFSTFLLQFLNFNFCLDKINFYFLSSLYSLFSVSSQLQSSLSIMTLPLMSELFFCFFDYPFRYFSWVFPNPQRKSSFDSLVFLFFEI